MRHRIAVVSIAALAGCDISPLAPVDESPAPSSPTPRVGALPPLTPSAPVAPPPPAVEQPRLSTSFVWVLIGADDRDPATDDVQGIFLVDRRDGSIVQSLPLPTAREGHQQERWDALVDDGDALIIAGNDPEFFSAEGCSIAWLKKEDGAELRRITGICTEGLALDARGLWAGGNPYHFQGAAIRRISDDGTVLQTIAQPVPPSDLTSDEDRLYFVTYYTDHVGLSVVDADGTTALLAPTPPSGNDYALAFDGEELLVCGYPNVCHRLARDDGATLAPLDVPLTGWITALAPLRR